MAATSLNTFLNNTAILSTSNSTMYTTPVGKTAVILLAQVANINTTAYCNTTFWLSKTSGDTELISNFPVPPNDGLNILTGKLVLMANDSLVGVSSSNNNLKAVLSILETQL